jgi:hypothetical protein
MLMESGNSDMLAVCPDRSRKLEGERIARRAVAGVGFRWLAEVVRQGQSLEHLFIPLPFVGLLFKWDIPVGGVVIAEAPKVGKIVAKIDEIETHDTLSIDLFLVNQLVPEQRSWDFGPSVLEENRSSCDHSAVTAHER